jgi:hypothetical protein
MGKVHNFQPSPGDFGGLSYPKRHRYYIFDHAEQNGCLKILIGWPWEKMSVRGGLVALHFFWSLEKGTRTFNFRFNEPFHDILGPLGRYDHPRGKEKTNTHPWSFFWQKIQNSTFLQIGAWNLYSRVLWYAEIDGVIFIRVLWPLGGVSPFFENQANFLRPVTIDG